MIGAVIAALMAASFFMPWLELFGESIGPTMLFDEGAGGVGEMPWQIWAFIASFAIAGFAAVLALVGRAAGALMLIAGAIPFGLIALQALDVRDQVADVGFPMPRIDNPSEIFEMALEVAAIGIPAYFLSAAALVLIGLVRMVRGT